MPDLWEGRIVRNPVTLLFGFARPLGLYVAAATRVSYIERAELA